MNQNDTQKQDQLSFTQLYAHLDAWATQRGIDNIDAQYLKYKEESGELAASILKGRTDQLMDDLGDTIVTVFMIARLKRLGGRLAQELEKSWQRSSYNISASEALITLDIELVAMFRSERNDTLIHDAIIVAMRIRIQRLARSINLDPLAALNAAWNEIKDRRGKTVNGSFIKESDC